MFGRLWKLLGEIHYDFHMVIVRCGPGAQIRLGLALQSIHEDDCAVDPELSLIWAASECLAISPDVWNNPIFERQESI